MSRQVYKQLGKTPLETINELRNSDLDLKDRLIGYAGRLDPMAEGLLLLLIDEENKERKKYERLPKSYEFQLLLGISTDTYDTLGLITQTDITASPSTDDVLRVAASCVGEMDQPYPPYSSLRIGGHPLFWWARENRLSEITIPSRTVQVNELTFQAKTVLSGGTVIEEAIRRTTLVSGDFRQPAIQTAWRNLATTIADHELSLYTFRVHGSNGLYVRSLANLMGGKLGLPALAYSIKRTQIGDFSL